MIIIKLKKSNKSTCVTNYILLKSHVIEWFRNVSAISRMILLVSVWIMILPIFVSDKAETISIIFLILCIEFEC